MHDLTREGSNGVKEFSWAKVGVCVGCCEGVGLTDGVSVSDDGEPVPAVPAREAEVASCWATAAR